MVSASSARNRVTPEVGKNSVVNKLYPKATLAAIRARAAAIRTLGGLTAVATAAGLFLGLPPAAVIATAVTAAVLVIAGGPIAAATDPLGRRFRTKFGSVQRVKNADPASALALSAQTYLSGQRKHAARRARRRTNAFTAALAVATLGASLYAFGYYKAHQVVSPGIYWLPRALAVYGPVLADPEKRPVVMANLPIKVLPVGKRASDAVVTFATNAPRHLEAMRGAAEVNNKEGVGKAADALEKDIQAADEALGEMENAPVSPDLRKDAAEARKKLGGFRQTVQKARIEPSQVKGAQSDLEQLLTALKALVDALANFLYQLMQFLALVNGNGASGNGVSPGTASSGSVMAAGGLNGQPTTQEEWDALRDSYARDWRRQPPTFVEPPSTVTRTLPSDTDPISDLTVPPNLPSVVPPKRHVDRNPDKTKVKPVQKSGEGAPMAPN